MINKDDTLKEIDLFVNSLKILELEIDLYYLRKHRVLIKSNKENRIENETINKFCEELYHSEIFIKDSKSPDSSIEFLVCNNPKRKLSVRIDNSKLHTTPHIHIDLDGEYHVASIAINDPKLLAGDLSKSILRLIKKWILLNNKILNEIWSQIQNDQVPNELREKLSRLNF